MLEIRPYFGFQHQTAFADRPRCVIAKIDWHPEKLLRRIDFIVTNLSTEPDWMVRYYNQRGTFEQHTKHGKHFSRRTRLFCRRFMHTNPQGFWMALPACLTLRNKFRHQTSTGQLR